MLAPTGLCRCICGTGRKETFEPGGARQGDLEGAQESEEGVPPQPPQDEGLVQYSVLVDQPLRGVPIREGELHYLSAEDSVNKVTLSLYVNGFSLTHGTDRAPSMSVSLSPFALVRNCKFQTVHTADLNLSDYKIFKVSMFTQGNCYYFGVHKKDDREAEEERSRWVLDFSRAMRLVTQSLFPPFSISCDPLVSVASTERRLMAGYLIHHDTPSVVSVMYCELHPHCQDRAKLTLYENELCNAALMDIWITERSVCNEKVGINCSCFCVEDHQFGTRTLSERKLWLRAISNVKVKLQNRAPEPTPDEINSYRLAIKEHINTIKTTLQSKAPTDALLRRSPPPQRPNFGQQPLFPSAFPPTPTRNAGDTGAAPESGAEASFEGCSGGHLGATHQLSH